MWDLIVSVPDHCLSFYFEWNFAQPYSGYPIKKWQHFPKATTIHNLLLHAFLSSKVLTKACQVV